MKKINKRISTAFGKKVYLLGIDKENEYVWLEEPKWDCGWYWGFGYIERYTNTKYPERARDVNSHSHWEGSIVGNIDYYDAQERKTRYVYHLNDNPLFVKSVLTEEESWKLAELMKTIHCLRESGEVFGRGGSHISSDEKEESIVKREEWAKEINEKILPEIFKEIDKLLSPIENANYNS